MPLWPPPPAHKEFETEISQYLESLGFFVGAATYHEIFPEEFRDRLVKIWTTTALYIRTRADRIAVHKKQPLMFQWESKTRTSLQPDILVEAFPLAIHAILQREMDVGCLYMHRNVQTMRDRGFWVTPTLAIARLWIPARWTDESQSYIERTISSVFPNIGEVVRGVDARGSNDPFVILKMDDAPHWKDLIQKFCEFAGEKKEKVTSPSNGDTVERPP